MSLRAYFPDHAGPGDLHQRRVGRVLEPGIGVGAPKIANRAIIGDIGAVIGAKPHIGRPVEPTYAVREGLLEGLVVRKALKVQRDRLTRAALKVEQLDFVPDLRGRCAGIGWRKAEIAFKAVESRPLLHRSARKGSRRE